MPAEMEHAQHARRGFVPRGNGLVREQKLDIHAQIFESDDAAVVSIVGIAGKFLKMSHLIVGGSC